MHTSTVLQSEDFQYWQIDDQGQRTRVDFVAFCPQYHEKDRIGVVAPWLDAGIRDTGQALLALTTKFYDTLRGRGTDFFDYPHHFAFFDPAPDDTQAQPELEELGGAWSALDVWPDSNWILAPGAVRDMLKKVFDWQINRLFWPETFMPDPGDVTLPDHIWKILANRLHTVYYYDTAWPTVEIRATQSVADMVQRSISRLPKAAGASTPIATAIDTLQPHDAAFPYTRAYKQVQTDDFLVAMQL